MTIVATHAPNDDTARVGWRPSRLSTRLILVTACFVLFVQVLIYVPAVAAFRQSWLSDRVMGAQMVALALTAAPQDAVSPLLEARLLSGIKGAQAIGVRGPGMRWLLATSGDAPPVAAREIDLRNAPWWGPVRGVFRSLLNPPEGLTRVIGDGAPGIAGMEWVELVIDEAPLRAAILGFSRAFLIVSLLVSAAIAALLYLVLHVTVVAPVRRLTENISAFAANPADSGRILSVSGRADELGRAEVALAHMETILAAELRQKRHLAELGLAVSKINHELRNMLTTAQLLGDRLGFVEVPAVKTIAPRLIRTLARAIAYCEATLAYGRVAEDLPNRCLVPLRPLVLEQIDAVGTNGTDIRLDIDVPPDLQIDVDAEQFGRVVLNLARNAVAALQGAGPVDAPLITVKGRRNNGSVTVWFCDNGPGVPEPVRDQLFNAFQSSRRGGGTGLGLPVVAEIVGLHGGTVSLEPSERGATFAVVIPDAPRP